MVALVRQEKKALENWQRKRKADKVEVVYLG